MGWCGMLRYAPYTPALVLCLTPVLAIAPVALAPLMRQLQPLAVQQIRAACVASLQIAWWHCFVSLS